MRNLLQTCRSKYLLGIAAMIGALGLPGLPCAADNSPPVPRAETHESASKTQSDQPPEVTNSIGMKFLLLPPGSFQMGCDQDERYCTPDEKPRHQVQISRPFYLGKTEVTQRQWKAVMGSLPPFNQSRWKAVMIGGLLPESLVPSEWWEGNACNIHGEDGTLVGDDKPVVCVSWNQAQEFIRRLNQQEGTDKYRLPTEAEWEYAARAGTETAYPFGDDVMELDESKWMKFGEHEWFAGNSNEKMLHAVGTRKPNPWGLCDMMGNVLELVQDKYAPDFYALSPTTDPENSTAGEPGLTRGGCAVCQVSELRFARRTPSGPVFRNVITGFRLAFSSPNPGQ